MLLRLLPPRTYWQPARLLLHCESARGRGHECWLTFLQESKVGLGRRKEKVLIACVKHARQLSALTNRRLASNKQRLTPNKQLAPNKMHTSVEHH